MKTRKPRAWQIGDWVKLKHVGWATLPPHGTVVRIHRCSVRVQKEDGSYASWNKENIRLVIPASKT